MKSEVTEEPGYVRPGASGLEFRLLLKKLSIHKNYFKMNERKKLQKQKNM